MNPFSSFYTKLYGFRWSPTLHDPYRHRGAPVLMLGSLQSSSYSVLTSKQVGGIRKPKTFFFRSFMSIIGAHLHHLHHVIMSKIRTGNTWNWNYPFWVWLWLLLIWIVCHGAFFCLLGISFPKLISPSWSGKKIQFSRDARESQHLERERERDAILWCGENYKSVQIKC